MPKCGRIHLGPATRTHTAIICELCGKAMTVKERATYLKIRFRVYEITMTALLSTPMQKVVRK